MSDPFLRLHWATFPFTSVSKVQQCDSSSVDPALTVLIMHMTFVTFVVKCRLHVKERP